MTRTAAAYSAMCPGLLSSVLTENSAAPQSTHGRPSTTTVTRATSRPASALRVARQASGDHSAVTTAVARPAGVRRAGMCPGAAAGPVIRRDLRLGMTSRYRPIRQAGTGLSFRRGGEIPPLVRLAALLTPRPPGGRLVAMIEIRELTKRYGSVTAVDGLTFTVRPGEVTGFLGPNGAGKSTTMRMILGLDQPASGTVLVNGKPPRAHAAPLRELGGMLDPRAVHPTRSAYHHLQALAQTSGIRRSRVDELIEAVGLSAAARRAVGKFSLGMSQRLGIAAALLGDPHTVILDEPVNGLDVEGIRWIRGLLADLAARGKTVLVSSHLMSEVAQTATHLIVIGQGRLLADTTVAELSAGHPSLEDAYVSLTDDAVEYRAAVGSAQTAQPAQTA